MASDIPVSVRRIVYKRDEYRCRWCGRSNAGIDLHHINYRSSGGKHTPENLISLCREHHSMAHSNKGYYPELLTELVTNLATTGLQLLRWKARQAKPVGPGGGQRMLS